MGEEQFQVAGLDGLKAYFGELEMLDERVESFFVDEEEVPNSPGTYLGSVITDITQLYKFHPLKPQQIFEKEVDKEIY